MVSYVAGKDKNTILEEMKGTAQPGSAVHEQQKSAIVVRCTEDLERTFRELAEASDKLTNRIYWLNIAVFLATFIGVIVALISLLK